MYVEEKDRSWCSSSATNDHRAITIEVASDTKPPYAVTEQAYAALIELVADKCKRNSIKQLLWKADKSLIGQLDKQNMTVHRWFADTSCPGEYLYSRISEIAEAVNKKPAEYEKSNGDNIYRVQIGAYKNYAEAEKMLAKARAAGFDDAYITNIKSVDEIAKEVINGKWGTGSDRKNRLTPQDIIIQLYRLV